MSFDFTYHNYDEHLEIITIHDIEVQLEIEVTLSYGDLSWSVDGVYIEGKSLMGGDEVSRGLAAKIMAAADLEMRTGGRLLDQAMASQDISFRGLGGDPNAHYRRAYA